MEQISESSTLTKEETKTPLKTNGKGRSGTLTAPLSGRGVAEEKPAEEPHPEIWSALLSALGAIVWIPLTLALILKSPSNGWHLTAYLVYCFGTFSMFAASAAYHWCGGTEESAPTMRKLDYAAIGLKVPGTFTPFVVLGLPTLLGWSVLAASWVMAAVAIGVIVLRPRFSKWSFIGLYMVMGWLGLLIFFPLAHTIGWAGTGLTLLGGVIYSIGAVVFNRGGTLPTPLTFAEHEIWHLCILAGAGLHYWVIYSYL